MNTLLISYDLKNANAERYNAINEAIKNISSDYWHGLTTTFIIKTEYTDIAICNNLKNVFYSDDKLLVVDITNTTHSFSPTNGDISLSLSRFLK